MSNSPSNVAVVTGASSGIGAVYADRLAARGHDLILIARRQKRLAELSAKLSRDHGVKVETVVADLEKDDDLVRVEKILSGNQAVSMLVNNAGLSRLAPIASAPLADSLSQIALNVVALVRLTHAVLPTFVTRNSGTMVNIASVLAIHSLSISSVYSGTKGFVLNFTRGLQEELAGTGVKVQLVFPASTATEIWTDSGVPLSALDPKTVMRAEDMVDAALVGLDEGERFTWPSVMDADLWNQFEAARAKLYSATQIGQPASRYLGEKRKQASPAGVDGIAR